MRYTGQTSQHLLKVTHPHEVELRVPARGIGPRLDAILRWHRERGLKSCRGRSRFDGRNHFVCWRFSKQDDADAFAVEFVSGEV